MSNRPIQCRALTSNAYINVFWPGVLPSIRREAVHDWRHAERLRLCNWS